MNALICNKCFAGTHRGRQPFSLTECGHVYCQLCIHHAEKKCPQCEQIGVHSLPLKEPHNQTPQIARLFQPVNDVLIDAQRSCSFQTNQINILVQRFLDMDKKYEMLKGQYYKLSRYTKTLDEKYKHELARREELERKYEWNMQCSITSPSNASTPVKHSKATKSRTPAANQYFMTPANMSTVSRNYSSTEGFRIPHRRAPKSSESRMTTATTTPTGFHFDSCRI